MKRQWKALIADGSRRLKALSSRERAFVALMGAALSFAVAFKAEQHMSTARDVAEAEIVSNSVLSGLERGDRAAFAKASDTAARQARQASIGGETIHIARARAQSVVLSLAQQAGIERVSTVVKARDLRKVKGEPVEAIEVVLTGGYDKAALARFLQLLAASEHSLSPVSVAVRAGETSRLEMRILAYALIDGDET